MKHILIPTIGFLVAPPIGALTWVLVEGGVGEILSGITVWAVVISIVLGTALGAPTYLYLRSKELLSAMSLSIGGAVISVLPWVLLSYPGSTIKSIVGQTVIIENGSYTAEGIIYQIKFIAQFGLCGAISGVVFWLIVRSLVTSKGTGRSKASCARALGVRRLMKYRYVVFLFTFVFKSAYSCSCIPHSEILEEAVGQSWAYADAVYLGKVVSKNRISDELETDELEIEIKNSWKGEQEKIVKMRIDTICCVCGISLNAEAEYLIFAYEREDGYLSASSCGLTTLASEATKYIKVLENRFD